MYTYEQFKAFIDNELKQNNNASHASVADSYRIAKDAEIKAWIDQSIGDLMSENDTFWFRTYTYTVPSESDKLEIPQHISHINKIQYDSKWYSVSYPTDTSAKFWWNGGNIIEANGFSLSEGTEIKIFGTLRSNEIIDDNSVVDFPPNNIRLLVLSVLLNAAGRDDRKKTVWFSQYAIALERFKKSIYKVAAQGKTEPSVGFGI